MRAVSAAAMLAFVLAGLPQARAHDWYPTDCCSGFDCYPIAADDVRATDAGWLIVRTGETVRYGHKSGARPWERQSEDGQFHRCSRGGDLDGATLCLFVPGMGS